MILGLQVWTCYKSELSFMFLARSGMSSANWILLNLMKSEVGNTSCLWTISTPRCQINKSTRLSFLDFPSTLYLDMSYLISHPAHLFGPTHLFGPIFYEIYIQYPPYSLIWPYLLNWHLRVLDFEKLRTKIWKLFFTILKKFTISI
jgi:hypothetical protein